MKKKILPIESITLVSIATISFVLLVGMNIRLLISSISSSDPQSVDQTYEKISQFITSILTWLGDKFLTAEVSTFILWLIVGGVCFLLVGLVVDSSKEVSDAVSDKKGFIHPKNYSNKRFWAVFITQIVSILFFSFLALYWVIILLTRLLPYSSNKLFLLVSGAEGVPQKITAGLLSYFSIFLGVLGLCAVIRLLNYLRKVKYW